jgi:ORF34
MRFDKRCKLVIKSEQKPRYDADLGKMVGGETTEKVVPANIGPVSAQLQNLLGDKLKDVTKVVRVRRTRGNIASLLIDGKPYNIVRTPEHTNGMTVFYVSEVKNGV